MRIIGAVDIGGTKIAAGAVAEDGSILYRLQCPTATEMGFEAAMQRTREMLHEISLQTGKNYSGIGVTVALENDADAGALAEASWGEAGKCDRLIYVTISTGIGAGPIVSGELSRGAGGAHPEIGHQLIDGSRALCYCSARGCWEPLASGRAAVMQLHCMPRRTPSPSQAE
jgi:glucokinase